MPSTAARPPLDARHRAMLAEMGIRIWQPGDEPEGLALSGHAPPQRQGLALGPAAPAAADPRQARRPAPPADGRETPDARPRAAPPAGAAPRFAAPGPAPVPAAPPSRPAPAVPVAAPIASAPPAPGDDPQALDWPALQVRLAQADLPPGTPRVLSGHGDPRAAWLFIADAPGADAVRPPEGGNAAPAEQLLDNMLRACGLSRQAGAFMVYAHHVQDGEALVRLWLEHVVQSLRPRVVVLMSRPATQSLLQTAEAPGRLRGRPLAAAGVPVVVSYPPALLLGKAEQKARAWADLCRARAIAG